MLYIISATIRPGQNTDAVGCFDPTRVRPLLINAFPEAIVCLEDAARSRIDSARELFSRQGMTVSKEIVLATLENDARRRGPIWSFRLRTGTEQVIRGYCERYGVKILSKEPIPEPLKTRFVSFLDGLRFPSIEVSSIRLDGNHSTEV